MRLVVAILAVNIIRELAQGCEQMEIFSCITDIQQEVVTSKFITNIEQLNSYCDKMTTAHSCVLHGSQHCSKELRETYQGLVDAEQFVTKKLCRPGKFQDEYLEEASCVASFFSTPAQGPCSDSYSELLAALSRNDLGKTIQSGLRNLCCAYFTVHKCAQIHADRCGRRTADKSILREIFEGLDHNCQTFGRSCVPKTLIRGPEPEPTQSSDEQVRSSMQPIHCIWLSSLIWLSLRVILVCACGTI